MKWSSSVSEEFDVKDAISEVVGNARADLGGEPPDLAIVFVSPHHAPDFDMVASSLRERLGQRPSSAARAGVLSAEAARSRTVRASR